MPTTVRHVDLARVGTIYPHGADGAFELTREILQDLVDTQAATPKYVVPITLGHWPAPGEEAHGRVENFSLEGDVLYGDFVGVPDDTAEKLREGRYPGRSIAFAADANISGNTYPHAMIHVALLGAEQPAVAELEPLFELFASDGIGRDLIAAAWSTVKPSAPLYPISLAGTSPATPQDQEPSMDKEQMLLRVLGVEDGASDEDIQKAYDSYVEAAEKAANAPAEEEEPVEDPEEAQAAVEANAELTEQVATLQAQVAQMKAEAEAKVASEAIAAAVKAKRVTDGGAKKLDAIYASAGMAALNLAIEALPVGLPQGEKGSAMIAASQANNGHGIDFAAFMPSDDEVREQEAKTGRRFDLTARSTKALVAASRAHPETPMHILRSIRADYVANQAKKEN